MKLLKNIKNTFIDMDKFILFISLFLIVFGTLNIVNASSREAVVNLDTSVYYYFFRHSIILILSFIVFLILIKIKTSNYGRLILLVFAALLAANLFLVLEGASTRGAQNWIGLGFFKLQPSELAKPTLIICLSLLFEKHYKKLKNPNVKHGTIVWIITIVGIAFPFLVFLQKDLGTAIILLGIFICLFAFSPISNRQKGIMAGIILVVGVVLAFVYFNFAGYLLTDAQLARFNYFNPCSKYASGEGYQVCNAFIAINNGGLFGVGIGKSTQKYSYIPEPHTDMVFSIISEEFGVAICSLIFIAYLIIIFRILKLSMKVKKISHKYICLGAATYIFLHIFVNLGGLFGLIPLTGVPLPFLSYGGSFTLSLVGMLAVIQRIHIEMKNERKA